MEKSQHERHDSRLDVDESTLTKVDSITGKNGPLEERGRLNVPRWDNPHHRLPSPDAMSELSIDDTATYSRRRASLGQTHMPELSRGTPTRLRAFWIHNKGIFMIIVSMMFGTFMNVATRLLEVEGNNGKGMHPFQILFARMSITVLMSSVYMYKTKTPDFPFGKREVRLLLVARGMTGFFGVFGMYYSLLYLPLADATVLTFLAPSLACWACSFLINEPFTRMEQIAAYISLVGVVLIARPTALLAVFSSNPEDKAERTPNADGSPNFADYDKVTPQQRLWAVGIAMVGVLGAASAYTTIRWIGKRAHPLISVNYFATWCTLVSLFMLAVLPDMSFVLPANIKEWSYLIFLGVSGFIMQFLLAAGLQYEKSSRATNMVYTQMLFALAFDKIVFGTVPGWLSIIGSSLILGSAIYVALNKEAAAPKDSPSADTSNSTSTAVAAAVADEELGLVAGMDAVDQDDSIGEHETIEEMDRTERDPAITAQRSHQE